YLIGAALVLTHFFVEVGMLIGSIGKLYPAPQWIWEELNILVYLLAPIMWFRLLCVISTHDLRFSQKENYAYIAFVSAGAFAGAIQPNTWYSYLAFPVLGATYIVQFTLDSRLPSPKTDKQVADLHSRPSAVKPNMAKLKRSSQHTSSQHPDSFASQSQIFAQLARGYNASSIPLTQRVGIWHSPADARFAKRLRTHLQPNIRQGHIDLWDPDQIQPGAIWQEERIQAVQSAAVAVVLVSADLMASDFITRYELPQILFRAMTHGTVILLIHVSPCNIDGSGLERFHPINTPNKPLAQLGPSERDKILTQTVCIICQRLGL
ncbi:MAG TPA: TIR domain-containing protein, partial [Ktedonobacteraceae bacterium]